VDEAAAMESAGVDLVAASGFEAGGHRPSFLKAVDESGTAATEDPNAIRPFHINIPESELADLRQRVLATRWPDKEPVSDRSQGVQLAKLQALVSYWETDYDWRKVEAKLNALPMFVTTIDGLDIQIFICDLTLFQRVYLPQL
jgi:Epoxide hydrolase N terminus